MIELFEETVGDVYPSVDFNAIRQCASNVFDETPGTVYRRLYQPPSPPSTFDRDFEILRAILANGLVLDGHGQSGSGAVLMDRIETVMYNRVKVFEVDTNASLANGMVSTCKSYPYANTLPRASTISIAVKK